MAQDYDKIVKENLMPNVLALLELFFNIKDTQVEPITIKLQHTLEQEPDFLFKVIEEKQENNYILQFEFQAPDKSYKDHWLYRAILYKGLILLREKLPVRQFFVYMGDEECTMNTKYQDDTTTHEIKLINMKSLDYETFLYSGKAELVVFAILTDFKSQNPEAVIEDIVRVLGQLTSGNLELKKYTTQLRILSKLRKFEEITFKILKNMPLLFDVPNDHLFIRGKKEGKEEGREEGKEEGREEGKEEGKEIGEAIGKEKHAIITAVNMMLKTDFDLIQLADLAVIEISLARKLKKELGKTEAKTIISSFKKEKLTEKEKEQKAIALAKELLMMPSLSDDMVAKIADYSVEKIKALREEQYEATKNKKKP